jgi:YD repeat-containing protein
MPRSGGPIGVMLMEHDHSRSFVVSYAYDAASNRTSMTDAESGFTSYA